MHAALQIPVSLVLKATGVAKPKYLVVQIELHGVMNTPTVVYAELFRRRKDAEKAVKAANDRLRVRVGNVTIGSRREAQLWELPIDAR
jgi:hypothetical protein